MIENITPAATSSDDDILAALGRSRTGWAIMIDTGDSVETVSVTDATLTTENEVRARFGPLFAEGVEFAVFAVIG